MVSCTDFSEDIQNLDNKVNNLGNTTQTELASLQKAITDLEAKLSAQYATKDEVAALKTTLENSIASEVAALSEDIAEVSAALNAAKNEINTAIAGLDEKKADKTAVEAAVKTATEAIAALQAELEAAKGDLEAEIAAVKDQIAATQESLQEQINGVDAKANELQNTLLSLGDYLSTLEAKVNEINNTLLSLGEYLPTIEAKILEVKGTVESLGAEYEANKEVVDAKLNELFSTLVSLSNHLEEYEATTDFKLVELQGSLAALSTYLEEYEASVDAKFDEILNTFESLSLFLDEKFAGLEATDNDLYKEIDGIRVVLSALNNLLTDEAAAREAEDAALYELIGSSVTALNNLIADLQAEDEALYAELNGVREAFTTLNNLLSDEAATREAEDAAIYQLIGTTATALNNLIADLQAEDEAIYAEIENVRTYVAQVYNALSTEIDAANAALEAHIAAFEAYKEVVDAKLAGLEAEDGAIYELIGTTATALNNLIADLQAEDEAIYLEINGVRESLTQAMNYLLAEDEALKAEFQEKVDEIYAEIEGVRTSVAQVYNSLMTEVAELTEQILANATAIAALEDAVEMLTDWAAAHEGKYDELVQLVTKHIADITAQIEALQEEDGAIYEYIGETATALNNLIADVNARMDEIEGVIEQNYNTTGAAIGALSNLINDIQADLNDRVSANEEAIKKLFERVQSLVYVPDYDDHKATISWAELYGQESEGILVKKSVLRYRVYANADEDAVAAAKAIATTWTPETFYYEVEPVKRAWTRSTTVPASLEITKVEAKGEYLEVEVLAKNFNPEFFFSYWYGDNTPRMAIKPEEGKPADEKSSYSVSLVLSDGNNNRSTEYTNLVPAYPEFVQAVIIDGTEAKKDITGLACPESENVNLLPYDLDPSEVIVLKDHALTFVMDDENYSASELIELGYDIQLDRRQVYTTTVGSIDHQVDAKPQVLEIAVADVKFQIYEENFVSALEENNTHVTLTSALTKEQYLSLKPEEKTLDIDFVYIVNGVEVKTTSTVEICNRLVNINFEVDVPWTLETALSTIADSKMYEGPVAATFEYDLAEAVENGKPLEGYSLYSIIHATGITTTYAPKCPISLSVNDETITATLKHGSARYAFPVNNNDDVVDYNQYVVTKRADFEDITFTVTLKMNLLEQAPHQYLEKDVTFTTEAGANGWLFGYWNALEDAYQKFLADGYIGYVDAPETGKAKFFEAFAQTSSYGNMGAMPVVNGKTGIPQNVNIPFTANNNESGEHKFQLWHEQLGLTPEKPYVDGTQHTILQSVKPYFQIPFTFTVNGTVDLPDYALDLDPVRVLNRGNEKIVNVYGEISKETNKYTVDVSDLAKYYYVVNKEGTKSLVNANNDVVTVDFTLSPMAGAEETGYNFNAVADDTDYTLTVDWTKAEPYILPMSEAVVNWGTYPHTEVGVNAILNVNGFPIVAKPITLVTADPLEIALNDVTVEVTHLSGTNAEPIVAKVYQNFVLTSAVEEGNLFNNNAKTIGGLWYYSKADNTYGVTMDLKFNRVYYKKNNEKVGWDESKIVLEKYTAENVVAPYEVGDLTGNVWIRPDDGDIQVPIYVEFDVVMTHRIHDASKTTCETKGTVTVKFVPEGWDK